MTCTKCGKELTPRQQSLRRYDRRIGRGTPGRWFCSAECSTAYNHPDPMVMCKACGKKLTREQVFTRRRNVKTGLTRADSPYYCSVKCSWVDRRHRLKLLYKEEASDAS